MLFISIAMSIFMTGCFDKVELEDRGLVLSIGIDGIYNSSDESNKFIVSLAFPDVSEKSAEEKINSAIKKVEGTTISNCIDLIDSMTSSDLYFGHTKVVVIGKSILEDEILLKEVIDFLERNREISRKIIVVGSMGNAYDIIEAIPDGEKMLGIYISDFYKNNLNPDFTYRLDLDEIIQNLLTSGDTIVPNIEVAESGIQFNGLILLKDYEFKGYMDHKLTKSLIYLMNSSACGEISVKFEEILIPLDIINKSISKNVIEQDGKIYIDVDIKMNVSISEYVLGESILIDSEKYKIIQKLAEEELRSNILSSLNYLEELDIDILYFKEFIRKNNFDIYEKYNLQSSNIFDVITININSEVKVQSAGKIK